MDLEVKPSVLRGSSLNFFVDGIASVVFALVSPVEGFGFEIFVALRSKEATLLLIKVALLRINV